MSKTKVQTRKVDFSCRAADAESVFVAGTFNNWQDNVTPMQKRSGGKWTASLDLRPGLYEFKFVVDGEWCCEPGGDTAGEHANCVPNEYGTMNRLIEVS